MIGWYLVWGIRIATFPLAAWGSYAAYHWTVDWPWIFGWRIAVPLFLILFLLGWLIAGVVDDQRHR